ncbi:hypothetical protein, partial [Corynebacterium flavescens]|uniref:hypothetical protein n=1 Tax=Corynebacterium flavescens TaxID=28028 RepID=UPI003FD0302F
VPMAVIISRRSSYCPNFATAPSYPPLADLSRPLVFLQDAPVFVHSIHGFGEVSIIKNNHNEFE